MSVKQGIETTQDGGALDTARLLLAGAFAVGSIVAYYWFATLPGLQRGLIALAGAVVAVVLALTTRAGRELWSFADTSRVEIRKMVWPTKQEATQTTLLLAVFVVILGVVMLLIDMSLNWALELLLGGA
jgi:preprotein translocase subunit SecE